MIDNDQCPRCGEAETLVHKFIECDYAKRIWHRVNSLSNQLSNEAYKAILGCNVEATLTNLTLNAEVLTRLSYLKDDQNYLVHPKTFVNNCLRTIATHESNEKIRGEIKNLLE